MFLKNQTIMNEGYEDKDNLFTKGIGSNIYIKNKKYLDLSFCAGTNLLGHNSAIFKNSIKQLIKDNISNLAAKNSHAYEFSRTLKEVFPKYSKFIFCNSGTEAVFKSLRIARAIAKKDLIISVSGSWHGSVNELLYTTNKKLENIKLSEGLESQTEKNIKFIPYNNIELSRKVLQKYEKKIMCVIIEPIQGCLPILAKNYLKFLNDYCKRKNIILIFDEMITGLRYDGSSVQDFLKLNPSISTFGKCFGGGLPIGIIAIKKNIEKKLLEKKNKVFFGGTFSGNSINTYIANKVLKFILKNKNKIFKDLNEKSNYFVKNLNNFFEQNNYDAKCLNIKSIIRIIFTKNNAQDRPQRDFLEKKNFKKVKLFRKFLFSKKIFYPSSGIIFFSKSTSYNEINFLLKSTKSAFIKIFK
tara:strand:+ start:798 stop:2033 length:1236 start_codon:yes stop_codon:yes gene_type:complete